MRGFIFTAVAACGGAESTHTAPIVDHACIQHAHERIDAEAAAPPQTASMSAAAQAVPDSIDPRRLESHRTGGSKLISPDDDVKTEIASLHVSRTSPKVRLCLDVQGVPTEVSILRSSCFPRYDAEIIERIRSEWRYSPYQVDGVARPVCTDVTFIYSQG
jgi:hypothetical protein